MAIENENGYDPGQLYIVDAKEGQMGIILNRWAFWRRGLVELQDIVDKDIVTLKGRMLKAVQIMDRLSSEKPKRKEKADTFKDEDETKKEVDAHLAVGAEEKKAQEWSRVREKPHEFCTGRTMSSFFSYMNGQCAGYGVLANGLVILSGVCDKLSCAQVSR